MATRDFIYDKIAGCLLGMAAGEALGRAGAGLTPYRIMRKFQAIDGFFGPSGEKYGDGSRFALMATKRLASPSPITQKDVALAYADMAGRVGGQWGIAADGLSKGKSFEEIGDQSRMLADVLFCGIPVGLWAGIQQVGDVEVLRACRLLARPAIAFRPASVAAFLVAYAIRDCLRNSEALKHRAELFEADKSLMSRMAAWAREASSSMSGEEQLPGEDVAERMEYASKCLQSGTSVMEFVGSHGNSGGAAECVAFSTFRFMSASDDVRSVYSAAAMGGDSQVNAAIVGALCGAYAGLSFVPADIQKETENASKILSLADEVSGRAPQ